MVNAELDEAQAGIKFARRNINNLIYTGDGTLMAESEKELKSLLMKVKEERKSWLKAQHSENEDNGIWSYCFMGNRWGNSGNIGRLFWGTPKSLQMMVAEEKMFRWHHQQKGHEFAWTPGVGYGQGGLACCGPWCLTESDTTDRLN